MQKSNTVGLPKVYRRSTSVTECPAESEVATDHRSSVGSKQPWREGGLACEIAIAKGCDRHVCRDTASEHDTSLLEAERLAVHCFGLAAPQSGAMASNDWPGTMDDFPRCCTGAANFNGTLYGQRGMKANEKYCRIQNQEAL